MRVDLPSTLAGVNVIQKAFLNAQWHDSVAGVQSERIPENDMYLVCSYMTTSLLQRMMVMWLKKMYRTCISCRFCSK